MDGLTLFSTDFEVFIAAAILCLFWIYYGWQYAVGTFSLYVVLCAIYLATLPAPVKATPQPPPQLLIIPPKPSRIPNT